MGQALVLGTDPVCFHEVQVQRSSVGQGRHSQNGWYLDWGDGFAGQKQRLSGQREVPEHSPGERSLLGEMVPELVLGGQPGNSQVQRTEESPLPVPEAGRGGPPQKPGAAPVPGTRGGRAQDRRHGARGLSALRVPGPLQTLCSELGPPRNLRPSPRLPTMCQGSGLSGSRISLSNRHGKPTGWA